MSNTTNAPRDPNIDGRASAADLIKATHLTPGARKDELAKFVGTTKKLRKRDKLAKIAAIGKQIAADLKRGLLVSPNGAGRNTLHAIKSVHAGGSKVEEGVTGRVTFPPESDNATDQRPASSGGTYTATPSARPTLFTPPGTPRHADSVRSTAALPNSSNAGSDGGSAAALAAIKRDLSAAPKRFSTQLPDPEPKQTRPGEWK